ncbi:hypothetical protein [Streptomyces sp. NRRL B-24484]|uniref:hypothetical protein n=1 Tax=Streptomyces sp. NRRL B-24484 TaxID=1463833 RepID=UPI0004BE5C8F|nr:hypothetical protein [Streptomyces sp. NRRL B-24484]
MHTMMASADTLASHQSNDFDDLYDRYASLLRAAAAEQVAAISPESTGLAEDLTEAVWADVAAGCYPQGARGLDGLLILLRDRARRVRDRALAATRAIREVVIDLDDLADEPHTAIPTVRALPATVSAAVAAMRGLPLAG